jgi:hypothetical protein
MEEVVPDDFVKDEQTDVLEQVQNDPRLADRAQEGYGHDLGQKLGGRDDRHEDEDEAAPIRGDESVEIWRFSSLLWRGVVICDCARGEGIVKAAKYCSPLRAEKTHRKK